MFIYLIKQPTFSCYTNFPKVFVFQIFNGSLELKCNSVNFASQ